MIYATAKIVFAGAILIYAPAKMIDATARIVFAGAILI